VIKPRDNNGAPMRRKPWRRAEQWFRFLMKLGRKLDRESSGVPYATARIGEEPRAERHNRDPHTLQILHLHLGRCF
jgi:hypothetical protein